jgi:chromosomal replication initiator protein
MTARHRTYERADPSLLWPEACHAVRAHVGEKNFETWIAPLRCTWTGDAVALEAPDRIAHDRVRRHFLPVIEEAVAAVAGHACPVHVVLPNDHLLPIPATSPSPDRTFELFVVGTSNAEAHGAAQALLRGESRAPLFVWGPTGVGKTHLLHAVCHALVARGTEVACLAAADFVEALVAAYEADRHEGFWGGLAPLGALLLDDIHSLAGREQIQEHLGEGLAGWVKGGRLLLLTSDRPPGDIPTLAAGWQARLGEGRIARIDPPERELRLAILRLKARALGLDLDLGLAGRIASRVTGSVRRLEGVLTRLVASVRLSGEQLNAAVAGRAVPELRDEPVVPVTLERIVDETADVFGVPSRALWGRSRRTEVRVPRQVAIFLARRLLDRPAVELALDFGRDRATISHAVRAITARLQSERELAVRVATLEERLVAGQR